LKVEFVNPKAQVVELRDEIDLAVKGVLDSGAFILGPNVAEFEREIAELEGSKHAVSLNSGTDALILALLAAGVGPGDEVITSPFTFVANVEAICIIGATPVFADIDDKTFNLDPEKTAAKITPKTKAIIPVHLFGQLAEMDKFEAICRDHKLSLIGDGAQAIEATRNGRPMGTYGDFSTLSFYPTKNLGGAGDGGMVLTNSDEMLEALKLLRFHGSGGGYTYKRVGFNSRLDELQASILRVKLRKLHNWNEVRRSNAAIYDSALTSLAGQCFVPTVLPGNRHVYHVYTLRISKGEGERDLLRAYLTDQGIGTSVFYGLSLHLQEAYAHLGYQSGDLPVSERVTSEAISLPIHSHLSQDQVIYVAENVRSFFAGR
jgi:dTDP-4-amino-4,6-dideoxygalactose transaminase